MATTNINFQRFFLSSKMLFQSNERFKSSFRFLHRFDGTCNLTTKIRFPVLKIYKLQNTNSKFFSNKVSEARVLTNTCENVNISTFQQMMHFRKKQAECSVLVELNNKRDIPAATLTCEQFGTIENAFSYGGESANIFLILEFKDKTSVARLLCNCQFKNLSDSFVPFSRIVRFDNETSQAISGTTLKVIEDVPSTVNPKGKSVTELIEDIYVSEKLSELNIRLRFFFCGLLKDSLSGLFPFSDVFPFGSSVNGIDRQGCDLDIMMRLYPAQTVQNSNLSFLSKTCVGSVRDLQRKAIYTLGDFFSTFLPGFSSMKKILHARVPILKFKHKILGMECDISINNMSAVMMSEILFFCGEIDPRVRTLIFAVKKWAKEANVTYDSPGTWVTNFGLSLLVIFFLQNRPIPVLPCLNDVVEIVGAECMSNFSLQYLSSVTDLQTKAASNKESLALLLKEFLTFLGSHPFKDKHLSVLSGVATQKKIGCPIWIQYPLEEDKNVTKNISASELFDMCEKAQLSAKYLSSNMQLKAAASVDLSLVLGIPNILKVFGQRGKRLDITSIIANDSKNTANRKRMF